MLRLHPAEKELKLVVGMCNGVLTLPRHGCQNVYRDHDRIDGFEGIPAFDAHVKPQIVAARAFDPANVAYVKFGAGHFQHRQRVVASRHAHGRIPIPLPDGTLIHNNSQKQTKVASNDTMPLCAARGGINPSVSRYGTRAHTYALRQSRNTERCSSLIEFSHLPVHPDQDRKRNGCGKDGDTDHNPSHVLFPPCVPPAHGERWPLLTPSGCRSPSAPMHAFLVGATLAGWTTRHACPSGRFFITQGRAR